MMVLEERRVVVLVVWCARTLSAYNRDSLVT